MKSTLIVLGVFLGVVVGASLGLFVVVEFMLSPVEENAWGMFWSAPSRHPLTEVFTFATLSKMFMGIVFGGALCGLGVLAGIRKLVGKSESPPPVVE